MKKVNVCDKNGSRNGLAEQWIEKNGCSPKHTENYTQYPRPSVPLIFSLTTGCLAATQRSDTGTPPKLTCLGIPRPCVVCVFARWCTHAWHLSAITECICMLFIAKTQTKCLAWMQMQLQNNIYIKNTDVSLSVCVCGHVYFPRVTLYLWDKVLQQAFVLWCWEGCHYKKASARPDWQLQDSN